MIALKSRRRTRARLNHLRVEILRGLIFIWLMSLQMHLVTSNLEFFIATKEYIISLKLSHLRQREAPPTTAITATASSISRTLVRVITTSLILYNIKAPPKNQAAIKTETQQSWHHQAILIIMLCEQATLVFSNHSQGSRVRLKGIKARVLGFHR